MESLHEKIVKALYSENPVKGVEGILSSASLPKETADTIFEVMITGARSLFNIKDHDVKASLSPKSLAQYEAHDLWAWSAKEKDIEAVVDLCLNAGASIDYVSNYRRHTLLYAATRAGLVDVMKLVISKGASLSEVEYEAGPKSRHCDSPLFTASIGMQSSKNSEVLQTLLDAGADIDQSSLSEKSQFNAPPLWYMVENGMLEVADFLVQKGANPRKTDGNGNTLMHDYFSNVFEDEYDPKVVEWMARHDLRPSMKNNQGWDVFNIMEGSMDVSREEAREILAPLVALEEAEALDQKSSPAKKKKSSTGPRL